MLCVSFCFSSETKPTESAATLQVDAEYAYWVALQEEYSVAKQTALQAAFTNSRKLNQCIQVFLQHPPTEETLQQCRKHWHATLLNLILIKAFTFGHHEIIQTISNRLSSFPALRGYIDSIKGYSQSGIVNDFSLSLSKENLIEVHQQWHTEEVALGIHALGVLLWPDHQHSALTLYKLPNPTPKAPKKSQLEKKYDSHQIIVRRRLYLKLLINILEDDIAILQTNQITELHHRQSPTQKTSTHDIKRQLIKKTLSAAQALTQYCSQLLKKSSSVYFKPTAKEDTLFTTCLQSLHLALSPSGKFQPFDLFAKPTPIPKDQIKSLERVILKLLSTPPKDQKHKRVIMRSLNITLKEFENSL